MNHIPHLLTFPRTGSHYFDKLVYEKAGISIDKSHSINRVFDKDSNKQKTIITIVRDPIDTISSYLTLQEQGYGDTNLERIEETITNYVFMYSFLYDYADCIIDFKDLVSRPDDVVERVFSLLEIKEDRLERQKIDLQEIVWRTENAYAQALAEKDKLIKKVNKLKKKIKKLKHLKEYTK